MIKIIAFDVSKNKKEKKSATTHKHETHVTHHTGN